MNRCFNFFAKFAAILMLVLRCSLVNASATTAENFIRDVSGKAFKIIETETSDTKIIKSLEGLFQESVEITWIAKFILGRYYKTLTPQQIAVFQSTYKDYLLYKYTPKFKTTVGYNFEIINTKPLGQDYYLINAKVFDPEKANPIEVEYRVKEFSNGSVLIRDISVEGVSLILTHRTDFTNFLHDNSFDDLIEKLKTKSL